MKIISIAVLVVSIANFSLANVNPNGAERQRAYQVTSDLKLAEQTECLTVTASAEIVMERVIKNRSRVRRDFPQAEVAVIALELLRLERDGSATRVGLSFPTASNIDVKDWFFEPNVFGSSTNLIETGFVSDILFDDDVASNDGNGAVVVGGTHDFHLPGAGTYILVTTVVFGDENVVVVGSSRITVDVGILTICQD